MSQFPEARVLSGHVISDLRTGEPRPGGDSPQRIGNLCFPFKLFINACQFTNRVSINLGQHELVPIELVIRLSRV